MFDRVKAIGDSSVDRVLNATRRLVTRSSAHRKLPCQPDVSGEDKTMDISVDRLRKTANALLLHLEQSGITSVTISEDDYWDVFN